MFKWERKLVEAINKRLLVFAFCIVTILTWYMRRTAYWYTASDFLSHFDTEFPGYLHTPFYTCLLRLLPALSIPPIVQVKMLLFVFDLGVAFAAVYLLQKSRDKIALFSLYTLLLVSPITIETGVVWARLDAVCMSAFLWSLVLYKKRHCALAGILLGIGTAILTQYTVLFLLLAVYGLRKKEKMLIYLGNGMITTILLNAAAIVFLELNPQSGILMLVNWLVKNPTDGNFFSGLLPWFKSMTAYFGYMGCTLCLIGAFWKPKCRFPAAAIHIGMLLYIGHILHYGW